MLKHLIRHLGDKPLTEIRREDLFNYIEKRRGETLFRCGDWTTVPVKDGTIRNELAILRHVLNVARSREIETSNVSFENVLPDATMRQRTLKSDERKRLLEASPVWLRRLLLTAMETALSEGDLIRLELDDVNWDEGVIVPGGGRKKTHVRQAAPLTAVVRALFEEMKHEYRQAKVKNLSTACLVFTKESKPISANMIHKAIRKACKTASVKDFRFHDTRHIAKTAWARAGIPVEAAMLGAGHKSVQMHRAYIHLQTSDVGKAFGTAKTFYNSFKTEKDVAYERSGPDL